MSDEIQNRRPISSRSNKHIQRFAAYLARRNSPTPNQISCLSVVFAVLGAGCLWLFSYHISLLLLCALFVQLRLMCNLLDGMVAVEGGKKTAVGDIFNEFPDRIADSVLLIALGYAADIGWLGWFAALLAAFTAYIRVFGGSLGFEQKFLGPMAKQHRMAVLTASCLFTLVEFSLWNTSYCLLLGLCIITVGTAITCVTRTMDIVKQLERKNSHV
ncbi:CDP-alcohol phosphatidyltransferase family protein [Aggregatibacter actinomycetemcomitans]|nr:CDP-alcohol phosphatidyltransferase family protein [Aggregatibacter actinomycetemcomitans]